MAFDWLYGPQQIFPVYDGHQLRSLVLEPDTIREIHEILQAAFPVVQVTRTHFPYGPNSLPVRQPFDIAALENVAEWERRGLQLSATANASYQDIVVDFPAAAPTQISCQFHPNLDNPTTDPTVSVRNLMQSLAVKIAAEGRPRLRWRPALALAPWLVWLAILGTWIWLVAGERPPVSATLFGSLVVAASVAPTVHYWRALRGKYQGWHAGNRVRSMNRREVREQRADRWADLKISAFTIPGGAVLGAVATYFISR